MSSFKPRRPLLSSHWKPTLDALEVLIGFGCILYSIGHVSPLLALGAFGLTLTASGAYGIYRRANHRR